MGCSPSRLLPGDEEDFLKLSPENPQHAGQAYGVVQQLPGEETFLTSSGSDGPAPRAPERRDMRASKSLEIAGKKSTGPQDAFQSITSLVTSVFQVPLAVVCLVDQPDLWVASGDPSTDLAAQMRHHHQWLFAWALEIAGKQQMAVDDTAEHLQLRKAAFVAGQPGIRFFAGAPLLNQNSRTGSRQVLGVLCVLDTQPRSFDEVFLGTLAHFAKLAAHEALALRPPSRGQRSPAEPRSVDIVGPVQPGAVKLVSPFAAYTSSGTAVQGALPEIQTPTVHDSCASIGLSDSPLPERYRQLQAHAADLATPEAFAEVALGPVLGTGSYGRVHQAIWKGAEVAVKVMEATEEAVGTSAEAQSALLEAVLSRHLSHPHIVQSYEFAIRTQHVVGEDGQRRAMQQVWIVQQFCNRGTLKDCVEQGWLQQARAPGSAPNAIAILQTAREIASAMTYLHANGLVHGDLTGSNVLLNASMRDHRRFSALVSDFGLACIAAPSGESSSYAYGTVSHMPPELLAEGLVSKAVDVYSFGVLLWEMWMGRRAWEGCPQAQVVHLVSKNKARLQLPPETPAGYKDLCERCLSFDHTQRPAFEAVLREVMALLEAELQAAAGTEKAKLGGYSAPHQLRTSASASNSVAKLSKCDSVTRPMLPSLDRVTSPFLLAAPIAAAPPAAGTS